jgi:hypothetical protein
MASAHNFTDKGTWGMDSNLLRSKKSLRKPFILLNNCGTVDMVLSLKDISLSEWQSESGCGRILNLFLSARSTCSCLHLRIEGGNVVKRFRFT